MNDSRSNLTVTMIFTYNIIMENKNGKNMMTHLMMLDESKNRFWHYLYSVNYFLIA